MRRSQNFNCEAIIVIILYVTGEHHVRVLVPIVLVQCLAWHCSSGKDKESRRIMHGLLETNLLLDFEGLP